MKHFIFLIAAVFVALFLAMLNRDDSSKTPAAKPVVRIFGYSAFTGAWGPGPKLKELFEKNCNCTIEFIEASDSGILLQRLKLEGRSLGADMVIGLDQFDLQKAMSGHSWQKIQFAGMDFEPEIKSLVTNDYFVPYDWGVLTFMARKSEVPNPPKDLDGLLGSGFERQLALEDPRTSSPGLQFLWWVLQSKGEEAGFQYLQKLAPQVHSYAANWSTAIGLYNRKQTKLVFSYSTSPIYYQNEEKSTDHYALEFSEPAPMQVEFLGVPEFCNQCDLAVQFVNLILSREGQKIVMEKNYMFPVLRGVKEGTPFAAAHRFGKLMKFEIPSETEVERRLKRWSELRRGNSP